MKEIEKKEYKYKGDKRASGRVSAGPRPVAGPCPVAGICGGCQWIAKPYAEQLREKETALRKLMEPFVKPQPIIGMENPYHYRNKVHAVFGEDRKHNPISGIYEEKSHRIVPLDSCLIENEAADRIIVSVRGLLRSFKIRPYNEDTGYGLLRHVMVRTGYVTGQIMVVLVLASPIMPSKNNFVKALLKLHPEITTIVVNVNDRNTSMVLGEKEQVIYGKGYIEDVLCGKRFRISPKSFYQVNPAQTEKLYAKALEFAQLTGKETVLDAYCGTGTIGMIAADKAAKVIGVELNADAVRDARTNAKQNQIKNITFYQNDAGVFLTQMAEQGEHLDVLLMDPPRSGSTEAFLDALVKIAPKRVVYVSCGPDTLARDLKYLVKRGYKVEKCVGVDMFPFTSHCEAVCLLSNRNAKPDTYVDLTIDMEEYHRIKNGEK
jgi:23S rRNA (uracil1939-C5)-methyltransferase